MKRISLLALSIGLISVANAQKLDWHDASLNPEQRAEALVNELTIDEKISLMMDQSEAVPRLGIPQFNWWSEALHGVARAGKATVLPQTIGMAATFDNKAVGDAFVMVSDEARAKFNDFRKAGPIKRYEGLTFWTPNVNIFRDPRWGRGQETYGEDPYLTSTMGVAVVDGLQGPKDGKYVKTLAGAKHYAVHSGPEWNRHVYDAQNIDTRDLWETYLPSFKALVDDGVGQVMCAYNRYEGEPCCSNKKLLISILRGEWGYDRIIVTDCWALRDYISDWGHNTHPSGAHAASDAVISGADLECGPVFKNLREAYDNGLVKEKTIDRNLKRVLTERFRLGEIDSAQTPWEGLNTANTVDKPEHRQIALDMARKSMTLLKNNGILPLKKNLRKGSKILVMGPNAADSVMQWGNYNGFPTHTTTILEGIQAYAPKARYMRGCDHVVSSDVVSAFGGFKNGITAQYWNGSEAKGAPVATATYTTPLAFDNGGAIVFAPSVDLYKFVALYKGDFTAPEDGDYILDLKSSRDVVSVRLGGKEVIKREAGTRNGHTATHMFRAKKGEVIPVEIAYTQVDPEVAQLKFDVMTPSKETVDFAGADVVVFVGGISPKLEGEEMKVSVPGFRGGDRETIELPAIQRDLIKKAKDAGKKVVLVNCSGSAVALAQEDSICDAILQAWYPGQAGGQAVAEVLFGDYNPAGRLPVTFYASDADLPDFEDYTMEGRTYRYFRGTPLYPFGHGLSYSTFEYGAPTLSASTAKTTDKLTLTVPVTNKSKIAGDEVVQVYMRNPADPSGPLKTLRAYKRVNVPAGKTVNVELALDGSTFATFDHKLERVNTRPGTYELLVGPSSADTPQTVTVTLTD